MKAIRQRSSIICSRGGQKRRSRNGGGP